MTRSTCVTCANPITVTTRNPNRRFCSPRCRVADWHAHHRRNVVANSVNDVANVVRTRTDVPNAVPAANGVTKCPHCRRDLAVIAVVIPADAAHVSPPEVIT
jgi:endogenous inhibitor of DNA gyrase (YacG/DUF329 family)